MDLADRVIELLRQHPSVTDVRVVGSRSRGDTTALSDLDIEVDVDDFDSLADDLPGLVGSLEPLGQGWDRLSERWNYMLMLPGPLKLDLIFDVPYEKQPPWIVSADNLAGIDHHFWDWTLWLASKQLRGQHELVGTDLAKMHRHLLEPLGVGEPPSDLWAAIDSYRAARDRAEKRFGVTLDRTMDVEVTRAIRAAL